MKKFASVVVTVLVALSARAQWTVVNLHPAGARESAASHVRNGQQVGAATFPTFGIHPHAGIWSGTSASWVDLHPPGGVSSVARGVGGGLQVGEADLWGTPRRALVWNSTAYSYVDLHPIGATLSTAYGTDGVQHVGMARVGGFNRASLWTFSSYGSWVNLNPVGSTESWAFGTDSGQQVGWAFISGLARASLWTGTASSWIDLHPDGSTHSEARSVHQGQQVGLAWINFIKHASLWTGTAASWISLHPVGASHSVCTDVFAQQQVGYATFGGVDFAGLWSGAASSWVDLSAFLPGGFGNSYATGIWTDGTTTYVTGVGRNTTTNRDEAVLWKSLVVAPTSFSMFRGTAISGNLGSLLVSDDNRLVMHPGVVLVSSEPQIQVILNATAPSSAPTGFSFSLESNASFGSAQQKIWLFNYITNLYEELDSRFATIADNTITVTVSGNTSDYIEVGTLAIRARVSYRALGPSLGYPWKGRIDKAWWNFPG